METTFGDEESKRHFHIPVKMINWEGGDDILTSILSPPAVSSDVVPLGTLQEARAAPGTT